MKVVNDALDQLHAQVFALSHWVVTLAALHPASAPALLSIASKARGSLLFAQQPDAQIELCVQALQTLNQSFAECRLAMSEMDRETYSPRPPG